MDRKFHTALNAAGSSEFPLKPSESKLYRTWHLTSAISRRIFGARCPCYGQVAISDLIVSKHCTAESACVCVSMSMSTTTVR